MSKGQMSRRALIAGLAGLAAYGLPGPAAAEYLKRVALRQDGFEIRPRSDWAGTERPPTYALEPEDVQLLVVHHTLIPGNGYNQDQVAKLLRDIYDFHTGPEKGWPDIAYNFIVDQYGGIWEAREGSLTGPVRGSATGGNQGYSQLCCFLGDLSNQPPTEEATASMAWLLAQLSDRYDIDTSPGTTVTLESLGSSRFSPGAPMTLSTLSGHRDVSLTACPGDAGYAFLQNTLPGLVNTRRAAAATTTTTETTTTTTAPTTQAPTTGTPTTTPTVDDTNSETDGNAGADDQVAAGEGSDEGGDDGGSMLPLVVGGVALAAGGVGIVAIAKRRLDDDEPEEDGQIPSAVIAAPSDEREDGTINLPTRLGLEPEVPDAFVPAPETSAEQAKVAATVVAAPPPVSTPEGPQRVWWAVAHDASTYVEKTVEELSREIHHHAANTPKDAEVDRMEWSRLDSLLAQRSHQTTAAIVAARPNAVFVLRSEPCLVVVTRPDGIQKRDHGKDALSIARGDVASIKVHFDGEDSFPDIEVTAS